MVKLCGGHKINDVWTFSLQELSTDREKQVNFFFLTATARLLIMIFMTAVHFNILSRNLAFGYQDRMM